MLRKLYHYLPYLTVATITLAYATLALLRHRMFQTYGYDLGIYDQTIWLYSRLLYPFITIEYKFALLNHFSPSLAFFAPLYWIWSDPRLLLITQAIMIGISAIPFIIMAKRKDLPSYLTTILTLSYLLFYAFQYAVNYDIHSLVFGATLIPWFLLTLENKQYKHAVILMFIIMGMKESFPILLGAVGATYILQKKVKQGIIIGITALLYLILVTQILTPLMEHFTGEFYRFTASTITSPIHFITNLFNTPSKIEVWRISTLWFSLIPLLSPSTFFTVVADLAFYFIFGNNHPETLTIYNHYRTSIAPLLLWSTIYTISTIHNYIQKKSPNSNIYPILSILLILPLIYYQSTYNLPLNSLFTSKWYQSPSYIQDNHSILQQIPPTANITAQNNLVPHISQRKNIYILWPVAKNNGYIQFPICHSALLKISRGISTTPAEENNCTSAQQVLSPCTQSQCYWLRFHHKTQYIVTDTHPHQNAVQLLIQNEDKLQEGLTNLQKAGIISIKAQKNRATLWEVHQ